MLIYVNSVLFELGFIFIGLGFVMRNFLEILNWNELVKEILL